MKNRSVEHIHIENLSKKRYEYFSQDKISEKDQNQIDDLARQILDYIKNWRYALSFKFIFEELTNLGWAPNLLYDDNGNFAISGDGIQSISDEPDDCDMHHFIKKDLWKPSIREALDYYLDYEDED